LRRFNYVAISLTISPEGSLQRLFSTFANGWPGVGLLLQRILAAIILVRFGIVQLTDSSVSTSTIPQMVAACAGVLLLVGLWTPVVGTLIAIVELWIALTHLSDPWIPIVLATLGGTAAMIGPGAWSIDARLFGRKHLET
jgi:putative oxidoreductase